MAKPDTARGLHARFLGIFSRSDQRVQNNLGIISLNQAAHSSRTVRTDKLEELDRYYENRQYQHLPPWDAGSGKAGSYIPVRKRQPRVVFAFARVLASRIASKLVGRSVWPTFQCEEDPDFAEFVNFLMRAGHVQTRLLEPMRRMLNSGSVFVRFKYSGGALQLEHYLAKHCYPTFDERGELADMRIQYVYEDQDDKDEHGAPRKKWFKLELGQHTDVLYDNPYFKDNIEPTFEVVGSLAHGFGFVQGEWFRTSEQKFSPDGYSLVEDAIPIIDAINYSLSQSDNAVSYNQDPQLTLKNMTEDEMEGLVRSSMAAWNLGREGEASFLESGLEGVQVASDLRDKFRVHLQDVTRIVLLDPEKALGAAQSGRAMEVLHGPMVDLIEELRPTIEPRLVSLMTKIAAAALMIAQAGGPTPVLIPKGWSPKSISLTLHWPPVFAQTIEDLQKKAQLAITLTNATVFSREWAARWLAKDFGVEDIELELQKVAAQPVINPFGAF